VLQALMISQIAGGEDGLDQLVCEYKTMSSSAIETQDEVFAEKLSHRARLQPKADFLLISALSAAQTAG
jgi:hypothetical protein